MFNSSAGKKFKKFLKDPDLFFYDMFRKRVSERAPASAGVSIELDCSVDINELVEMGLSAYLQKQLGGIFGPRDGADKHSILISSDNLYWLIAMLFEAQKQLNAVADIYTLGGGVGARYRPEEQVDLNSVYSMFRSRSDLVCELSNGISCFVCHVYLYDHVDGVGVVRANNVWQKKFVVAKGQEYFCRSKEAQPQGEVDVVYTWVNHADPNWQRMWNDTFPSEAFDPDRYTSNDELIYSMRSIHKYAPWVHCIHIVSNCSRPNWLADVPNIKWVTHEEIFPDPSVLPTFSSHAIEACLHRIPGLAEQFIYFNDDFVLNQPCLPCDFFDQAGHSLSYFEPYGMVVEFGEAALEVPDYLQAALTSNRLLSEKFPGYTAKNLHRHIPYALKRSVIQNLEEWASEAFQVTRCSRRRNKSDVNVTSFLYHHYAGLTGHASSADAAYLIVRPNNITSLFGRDYYKYKFLCFNDGAGSSGDELYKKMCSSFYTRRLNSPSPWEQVSIGALE